MKERNRGCYLCGFIVAILLWARGGCWSQERVCVVGYCQRGFLPYIIVYTTIWAGWGKGMKGIASPSLCYSGYDDFGLSEMGISREMIEDGYLPGGTLVIGTFRAYGVIRNRGGRFTLQVSLCLPGYRLR